MNSLDSRIDSYCIFTVAHIAREATRSPKKNHYQTIEMVNENFKDTSKADLCLWLGVNEKHSIESTILFHRILWGKRFR
jgi:hypothetical protein